MKWWVNGQVNCEIQQTNKEWLVDERELSSASSKRHTDRTSTTSTCWSTWERSLHFLSFSRRWTYVSVSLTHLSDAYIHVMMLLVLANRHTCLSYIILPINSRQLFRNCLHPAAYQQIINPVYFISFGYLFSQKIRLKLTANTKIMKIFTSVDLCR